MARMIAAAADRALCTGRPSLADLEVYRSGSGLTVRCIECGQRWPMARTNMAKLLKILDTHRGFRRVS